MNYREDGAASVYMVSVGLILTLVAIAAIQVTMFVNLKHTVAGVADLSALAASKASAEGRDGCTAARQLAAEAQIKIKSCQMDYDVASITATAQATSWWAFKIRTESRARAAPIEYVQ